jgi:molybdopterin-guanine dinucleotide biosynthesis protein A
VTEPKDAASRDVAGVILAGGRSRRMGTDKTRLHIGEQLMLERVVDRLQAQVRWLVLSVNDESKPAHPSGLPIVRDAGTQFGGPLFGILSGLKWARQNTDARWVVSAPADAPFLPGSLISRLRMESSPDGQITVARSLGRLHPTIALWPVSLADALESWVAGSSQHAVRAWLETRHWSAVDFACDGGIDPFFNVNTPEDLAVAREHAGKNI